MINKLIILIFSFFVISCSESDFDEAVKLDLTPEIQTVDTILAVNQTVIVPVVIKNIGEKETTEPITFQILKMNPNFSIISYGNSDWDVVEQPTRWRFTSKEGVVINGNDEAIIDIKLASNNYPLSGGNFTVQIIAGTGGGESPTNNNIKVQKFFIL